MTNTSNDENPNLGKDGDPNIGKDENPNLAKNRLYHLAVWKSEIEDSWRGRRAGARPLQIALSA